MRKRLLSLALLAPLLGGCFATKRDLQEVRTEVAGLRSSQEAMLTALQRQQGTLLDSLRVLNQQATRLRGDLSNQIVQLERQLIQLQELTGQSQQRLADLRQELRDREEALRNSAAAGQAPGTPGDAAGSAPAGDPEEIFKAAQAALQRGSFSTARTGFEEFVRSFPQHARAAEAQLLVGEAHEKAKEPQKALDAYARVLELYPNSSRAPTALYRAALIEVERGNRERARSMLNQITAAYSKSPEAAQAKTQLTRLRR